jgi:hypothetical protein
MKGVGVLLTFRSQSESSKANRILTSLQMQLHGIRVGGDGGEMMKPPLPPPSMVALLCSNVLVLRSKDDGVVR